MNKYRIPKMVSSMKLTSKCPSRKPSLRWEKQARKNIT
jgi:hypothetical protein